ncbi:MAG TPA: hypothetical protein VGE47_14855 [Burkholderiaceae bacterium]
MSMAELEAGESRETRTARLLLGGWAPGHEALFESACQEFHWQAEPGRLERLGHQGLVLGAAVLERQVFFSQRQSVVDDGWELICRLRDATDPTERRLTEDMPKLRVLLERYPNWLPIVTSAANIERWLLLHEALPASRRLETYSVQLHSRDAAGANWRFGVGMLVCMVALFGLFQLLAVLGWAPPKQVGPSGSGRFTSSPSPGP